ncbi:MAG: DNA polymerase III subunit delta [Candidatus Saccharibacteria bacterium]
MTNTTAKNNPKNGIYLFYGEDGFSVTRKVERWKSEFVKKYSASALTVIDGEGLEEKEIVSRLETAVSPSLFAAVRLVIAKDCLPRKASAENLAAKVLEIAGRPSTDCFLVFWETGKPDRRLSFTKQFLAMPINVNEFHLPHGRELNAWLIAQAQALGSRLTAEGAEVLAQFLGRDFFEEKRAGGKVIERKEFFDLYQAYSELLKLSGYSREIGKAEVEMLVRPKVPENVFALSDHVLSGDRKAALKVVEQLFGGGEADEKGTAIKLAGLLSEQLRSLAVVSLLKAAGLSQEETAERLGWSSGRVFITSKNSAKIDPQKLKLLLRKLLKMELLLKSTDVNPRFLLERFVIEACAK